jgi:hypothetical protein
MIEVRKSVLTDYCYRFCMMELQFMTTLITLLSKHNYHVSENEIVSMYNSPVTSPN